MRALNWLPGVLFASCSMVYPCASTAAFSSYAFLGASCAHAVVFGNENSGARFGIEKGLFSETGSSHHDIGFESTALGEEAGNPHGAGRKSFRAIVDTQNVSATVPSPESLVVSPRTYRVELLTDSLIELLPFRDLIKAVAILPGIDERRGNLFFEGGQSEENGFMVDGAVVSDVFGAGSGVTIPQDAVDRIDVINGKLPAEYGGMNSGLVITNLKTGGDRLHASLRLETDNYTGQGKKALGGYSYGYSDYVATLSGPAFSDGVRFFATAENEFYRDPGALYNGNPYPMFWDGFNFKGLIASPQYTVHNPNALAVDTLDLNYPAGNSIGGQYDRYSYAGTLMFDIEEIHVRASGSYSDIFSQYGADISSLFDTQRLPVNRIHNGFANIRVDQSPTSDLNYELDVNYFGNHSETGFDPVLGNDFAAYGAPASNPVLANGATYLLDTPWYIFGPGGAGGLSVYQPGTLLATDPAINSESAVGGRLDFTYDLPMNELKFGGEYRYYTIRHYEPGSVANIYYFMNESALTLEEKETALRAWGSDNYGYDVFGNEINDDQMTDGNITDFGPRHPTVGAVYVQDQLSLTDLQLVFGLRYDYDNPDSWGFKDPQGITFVDSLAVISTSSLTKTKALSQVSPRLGLSFTATELTTIHADYGKFIQEPLFAYSYSGMGFAFQQVGGGIPSQQFRGFDLMPERSSRYELGVLQRVGDFFSFDITAYYKDYIDRLQMNLINPDAMGANRSYYALTNGVSGSAKGIEVDISLLPIERLQARLHYTYTGLGLSSLNTSGGSNYVSFIPAPESDSHEHAASFDLDYRFRKGDCGPVLEQLGINFVGLYKTGYPYMLYELALAGPFDPRYQTPLQALGYASSPSTFEIDLRVDKTVEVASLQTVFYIYVQNLFNAHNADNVFVRTNSPSDDGWLSTTSGHDYASAQYDPALYAKVYSAAYLGDNSGNYESPRQIRFGLKVMY